MLPRCGRVAHICEANNRTAQWQQKSKRESEKSQLPLKSEGCNERQGFRGNCDSQGKLGMCPSLAEPDSGGIPRTSRRQRNPRATLLAHGASGEKSDSFSRRGEQDNVINLKRLLNGKQNVWKYQNGEEKSDSDGREKDV